ncbi:MULTISPECIES: 1,4-dihydroxy-6-naphthoate synthase [Niastella]|uniref:1,4-dihydroxy-6-naphtoate synthase n=1 Tax=Niastella soli TaxID=2821487 RepID=A0ABS3YWD0_9BACT|nr:1,4-dihydroxy-6-naphthoate synthase [Niastella soli]MBO9201476.1 1,4-dihydroxy-6-naphthoate synthase [Niastella soli]
MKLTIGFSPCPNDTFIFDALVNNKIDTEGITVTPVLEDVQTLNEWAIQGKLDVTKISYGVLPLLLDKYIVLNAGGALGKGVGPLLITKQIGADTNQVNDMTIAIPGEHTTAHMLFSLAYPQATKKKFMVFSAIEDAVLSGAVDAGVIIHENRFTYQQKGLHKLVDLGEYWEQETGNPIPLGGIVMKKSFDSALQQKVDALIKRSLEYAFKNYPLITEYVKQHSQEMSETVMRQHIDLYVNNYSLQLGPDGKAAVNTFMDIYEQLKKIAAHNKEIFLATTE